MSPHLHSLAGCRPAPLAHYLKALGILRLVSEQVDPSARGWWQDEQFRFLTRLDLAALKRFFLEEYRPTPLVSPWNKGSGFYVEGRSGAPAIESSAAPRFAPFRVAIAEARRQAAALAEADAETRALKDLQKERKGMTKAEKAEARRIRRDPEHKAKIDEADRKFKRLKAELFGACRSSWRGPHLTWMESAVVLADDGNPSYPSLLGTGGNDGRLDFTNNSMLRLGTLFDLQHPEAAPRPETASLLEGSLFSAPGVGQGDAGAIGQFLPGAAGGANSTTGPDGDGLVNPWDFVLMLEGAVVVQARATRRLDAQASAQASAPFALFAQAAGYESPGDEKSSRGEQWLPLWSKPASLGEVAHLFGEARLQAGQDAALRPVDAVRALARLGTARGLTAFTRYGFLERNGQSTLAVPLGRLAVRAHPQARLVDDLAPWLQRLDRQASGDNAPARLVHAVRALANVVFAALRHDPAASRWQAILLAAARIELLQVSGTGFEAGPIPKLRSEWLEACDDGSAEWRLAVVLAGAVADPSRAGGRAGPVREHAIPLAEHGRFATSDDGQRLLRRPEVVMGGRSLVDDAIAVVSRRLTDARYSPGDGLPLRARRGRGADPRDLAAFIAGQLDEVRLLSLARAAMAIESPAAGMRPRQPDFSAAVPEDAWWVLRIACASEPFAKDVTVPLDPAVVRRAASGDGAGAVELAAQRLRARGLHPAISGAVAHPELSRRWVAALAFPLSRSTTRAWAPRLDPTSRTDTSGADSIGTDDSTEDKEPTHDRSVAS